MQRQYFPILILSFFLVLLGCAKKSESQQIIGNTTIDTTTLLSGIDTPWEILWGPDNFIWFTERQGTVSRLNPESGQRTVILTIEDAFEYGEGGLLGMALHPDFSESPYVYLVYNYTAGALIKERLVRYIWNGTILLGQEILIDGISANSYHNGSRLVFGPDGKIYMSTGDAGNTSNSQNLNSLSGKILRINPDGSIPSDNPDPGSYVWAYGLRNSQGLVFTPQGFLYGSEHGPDTDDELNLLESGRNYGWPNVAGFCNLPNEITFCNENNVREPLVAWTPTLAVAGIEYYNHPDIPEWQNSILMTSLKASKLVSLKLSSDGLSIIEQSDYLVNAYGRLRDVCVSPDGRVFIGVSNRDGRGTPRPGDDKIIQIKSTTSTSISEQPTNKNYIRIFPNPVDKFATVELSANFIVTGYSIINQLGQIILQDSFTGSHLKLNAANLKPGYYFFNATGHYGFASTPFMVR